MALIFQNEWNAFIKVYYEGITSFIKAKALRAEGYALYGERCTLRKAGEKVLGEGNKPYAKGLNFCDVGNRLIAESVKLSAEGDRLIAEGEKHIAVGSKLKACAISVFTNAVTMARDDITVEWRHFPDRVECWVFLDHYNRELYEYDHPSW